MKNIKLKSIFGILFFFLLISRILTLTGNYNFPISPVMLQIIYIILISIILIRTSSDNATIKVKKQKSFFTIIILLLLHTILWGTMFVNPSLIDLTSSMFKSQIMFLIVVLITLWATIRLDAIDILIKSSFYAISCILIIQLILNFSELNLSNIANIMSKEERYRANFGFGHYNTLGGACLCNIVLWTLLDKKKLKNIIYYIFLLVSIIMLLCSASRSSLTALALFLVIYALGRIFKNKKSGKRILLNKIIKVGIIIALFLIAININVSAALEESQRTLIFEKAIPVFLNSGRILQGLGYVSNTAYGTNLTPYTTYWLDNGYAYILISTGVLGFLIILGAIILLIKKIGFTSNDYIKSKVFPILIIYLYTCLFETNLFNSGYIANYIYLVIFLYYIYYENDKLIKNKEKER